MFLTNLTTLFRAFYATYIEVVQHIYRNRFRKLKYPRLRGLTNPHGCGKNLISFSRGGVSIGMHMPDMVKKVVYIENAPKPIGPYSQGVKAGNFLLISGQIPIDPATGKVIEGSFRDKVVRVLENTRAIVEAAGESLDNVVKVTVYLCDISKFDEFNEIYAAYFREKPTCTISC